eukprot:COSAG03_NODE_10290_length_660_cov_0.898396_1_plen_47_part_01
MNAIASDIRVLLLRGSQINQTLRLQLVPHALRDHRVRELQVGRHARG